MNNLNNPCLILTPLQNEFCLTDTSSFLTTLTELKFLGHLLSKNESDFEAGEDFLHKITFLGCSPTLYSDNGSDIFIRIIQSRHLQFFHCDSMPPPRCPHCHKTNKDWPVNYQHWLNNKDVVDACPDCDKDFNFASMKWKKNGGYGKLLIQIHGVQEQLAVPNQNFLTELEMITGTQWEYFFAT